MASEFAEKYRKQGFTDIVVLKGGEFKQSASSHRESTTEFSVAKKEGKFFKIRIYESLDFLKRGNDTFSLTPVEISESEYRRLALEERREALD
jgi:hypothetical protein